METLLWIFAYLMCGIGFVAVALALEGDPEDALQFIVKPHWLSWFLLLIWLPLAVLWMIAKVWEIYRLWVKRRHIAAMKKHPAE